MIALRKENKILAKGSIRSLDHIPDHLCAYTVSGSDSEILVIHNLTDETAKLNTRLLNAGGSVLYLSGSYTENADSLVLDPCGTLVQYIH